ncbi:MAG TPA: transcriptional regulator, partial [Pyrinomonadaceae bacterium]|nr:transcriptional regulator [Pyrinomonadaceae bacterium]
MAKSQHVIYVFGEFTLDPSHRTFSSNSQPIHLPAKEFDTLVYFVENRGRTLTKDEMMSAIWDDTFVEESNLAQYVSRLRKILDTKGRKYIQTFPKKGYCFDADVSVSRVAGLNAGGGYGRAVVAVAIVSGLFVAALIFAYLSRNKTVSAKVPFGAMPTPLTD